MPRIKKKFNIFGNIALLILVVIIMIIFFELSLRIFYPQNMNYLKLDKTLQYRGIPNFKTVFIENDFSTLIELNSRGLRDYEHEYKNPEDKYRILVLGDSMTFGYGVEGEETYPKALERLLNEKGKNVEVINAGVTAYENSQELAFLEAEGWKYKPNLVILGFMMNDVSGNYFSKGVYDMKNGVLIKKYPSFEFSFYRRFRNFLSSNSHFAVFIKKKLFPDKMTSDRELRNDFVIDTVAGIDYPEMEEGWEKTFLLMEKLEQFSDKNNIKFLVAILPTKEQISELELEELIQEYNVDREKIDINKSQRILSDYLEKNRIDYIDLYPEMKEANKNNEFYHDIDGHFNPGGHEFAAELIQKKLEEER